MTERLTSHAFTRGFSPSLNPLDSSFSGYAEGSRNQLLLGAASARPWRGMQSKGANTGSRKSVQLGKTWGGIKDIGGTQGSGSLFEDFGRSLWLIGSGQASKEGTDLTGITLSTTLKVAVADGGAYSAAKTYTAGLGQPSSPDVAIVSTPGAGYSGLVSNAVSVKIARFRSTTGARSRASTTSVVITPSKQTFRVTFPASATGQDYWRVFVTQQGFGGVGLHYALAYNGSLDISEATVAAGTVDGVPRSLEFEFKDGDLVEETAYVDDFTPPAGTHAVRVEGSMVVLGCYGDSTASVSSTSTGTCGAVSLPYFYESYRPRDIVRFPEQVVDALSRSIDSFGYVAHKNSVSTLQYVGLRDGTAVVATTAWPDVGIQYPGNWCLFQGRIAAIIGKGSLVLMRADGSPDYEWGAKIRDFIKDWEPEETVLGFHPDTLSIVVMNNGVAVSYSLENNQWSPPEYFSDAGVTGSALSCATSQGELVVSVTNGAAYAWDEGATAMPVTSITNWKRQPKPADVMEILASIDTDAVAEPLVVSCHANMRRTYVRDGAVTNGNNTLTSASAKFDSAHTGDMCCIFGTNVGGAGVNFLVGRMTYVSATQVSLSHPTTGATLNAGSTLSGCYVLLAYQIATVTLSHTNAQHTEPLQDFLVQDCLSFAIGVSMVTGATRGQVYSVEAWGSVRGESVSRVT